MILFGEKAQFLAVFTNVLCLFDANVFTNWLNGAVAVTGAIILFLNNVQTIKRKIKNLQDEKDDKDTE